jgi:hypothetical protein
MYLNLFFETAPILVKFSLVHAIFLGEERVARHDRP